MEITLPPVEDARDLRASEEEEEEDPKDTMMESKVVPGGGNTETREDRPTRKVGRYPDEVFDFIHEA